MPRLLVPFALLAVACTGPEAQPAAPEVPPPAAPTPPASPPAVPTPPASPPVAPTEGSIGSARMEADGTLVLQLRATTGSAIGDALLRYPPDHADYAKIRGHVGPIEPGQERPVASFPDPSARRYQVSYDYRVLGTIEVRSGETGKLTLTATGDEAQRLADKWREVEKNRSFSVSMHMPTRDGSRGPYGARIYRVQDADYVDAVRWMLLDANYEVGILPAL
ncbi:hypothetical protein [Nannocystis pusilla]|uniref:hypothetical protein n=1 Tax=Nannocystis pusilla TaxID=889268 RepID=UPI003B7B71CB